MSENFECEVCHGVFRKSWSDEDAAAEHERVFGEPIDKDEAAFLCTPCYNKFMATLTN